MIALCTFVVLIALAYFLWPSPWVYDTEIQRIKAGTEVKLPIRFHRESGKKQTQIDGKWLDGSVIID